jgi:hypothetical protein
MKMIDTWNLNSVLEVIDCQCGETNVKDMGVDVLLIADDYVDVLEDLGTKCNDRREAAKKNNGIWH